MAASASAGERGNGAAVAGFVLGLIGLITSVIPLFIFVFPGVLDVLGIIFSVIGRRNAQRGASQGGLATAGLVLAIIGLVIFIGWWVLFGIGASVADRND